MSNPFVKSSGTTATPPKASASAQTTISRPDDSEKPDAKVTKKDPFARPTGGGGDGAKIQDDLGSLLVVRPTEFLEGMDTSVGSTDAVRADVPRLVAALRAVLDLHRPVEVEPSDTICGDCSFQLPNGRYFGKVEEWPCPTVRAVEAALVAEAILKAVEYHKEHTS